MNLKELLSLKEQQDMVTTIARVLNKEKEIGKAVQQVNQPKQSTTSGTAGTIGSSKLSTQQTQTATTATSDVNTSMIKAPVSVPANTKIEPMVSTNPNLLKFKMDNAVFSLDVKDPQNTQLLQRLSSMGIKENK
jgi:hypothetical protein